ncbi:LAMI_0F05710g1_1 [Lachancea mirantina]|uniref:LAMI_0F05710g1_1 n=1 Tax=Lachancea mirantina TaxID=1230905 RepID=A0A1G4JYR1_9SACH|nr:LAMI_0F05710g1_1 [Lachancea mirantina]
MNELGFVEEIDENGGALIKEGRCDLAAIPIIRNKILKIGRNERQCDIVLNKACVSSIHCTFWGIKFDEDSIPMCYVKDCSLNGILLNEQPLQRDQTCLLEDGDIVTIPAVSTFRFYAKSKLITKDLLQQLGVQQNIDKWTITPRVIGSGTFGHVLVAVKTKEQSKTKTRSKTTRPLDYATKVIKLKPDRVDKEAQILLQLRHPNIIRVHSTFLGPDQKLYLIQDLVPGGDLFSYLAKEDRLMPVSETEALVIVYQIIKALIYLHSEGVVHRDLKLDNILLCVPEPCTRIVLADFGIARNISSSRSRMHTVVGTPEYCAPEVGFRADRLIYREFTRVATLEYQGYDAKCDIWSLGVITHIILTGISPFYSDGSEGSIIRNAKNGHLNFEIEPWRHVSDSAKGFVRKLLQVNASKRPNSSAALQHSWLQKHKAQLRILYHQRILRDVKHPFEAKELHEKRRVPKNFNPHQLDLEEAKKLRTSAT